MKNFRKTVEFIQSLTIEETTRKTGWMCAPSPGLTPSQFFNMK